MQTYQHTSMQTYHYGDIYCRVYFSFQRKAEQSFPFTKAKQAAGTATAERQTNGTPQGIYGENTIAY